MLIMIVPCRNIRVGSNDRASAAALHERIGRRRLQALVRPQHRQVVLTGGRPVTYSRRFISFSSKSDRFTNSGQLYAARSK